jgi:transposase
MTTKQISEAVNRPERTVQGWAKRTGAKMASIGAKLAAVAKTGKPADWDLPEAVAIIELGLGKNAASLFRASASQAPSQSTDDRLGRLETMVAALVGAVAEIIPALRGAPASPAALPPPAELEPRAALRKIVEAWARKHGRDYHGAWSSLYREYGYRYHRDIVRAAKNRDQSVLDYAESETILGELLALAFFLYGQQEAA